LQKYNNVVASLNRRYYDHSSNTVNSIVIGSWDKNTQITPPPDVDVLFCFRIMFTIAFRIDQAIGNLNSSKKLKMHC
jgi:hypothetical protein